MSESSSSTPASPSSSAEEFSSSNSKSNSNSKSKSKSKSNSNSTSNSNSKSNSTSKSTGSTSSKSRAISAKELAKHTSETDLWIAVDGKVFDVTKLVATHPGGKAALLKSAGQDGTDRFENKNPSHSDAAKKKLKEFQLGVIDAIEIKEVNKAANKNPKEVEMETVSDKKDSSISASTKGISSSELAKHNKREDAWVAVDGKVYNVTDFLAKHPGGDAKLLELCGKDSSQEFHDNAHPAKAKTRLLKMEVGDYLGDEEEAKRKTEALEEDDDEDITGCGKTFASWTYLNPFVWFWSTSLALIYVYWEMGARGVDGFGGRFEIVGFNTTKTEYAYKLRDPTTWELVAPWLGYVLHNAAMFTLIYFAQKENPKYSTKWRWFNWRALLINLFFIFLKTVQGQLWYNGMSSVLPLWFGTGTVATYLLIVYIIRIRDRGIIFGLGKRFVFHKKILAKELIDFVRKYHAYYIAFGIINDFWFHPFESTPGHLLGKLNDVLLLWQMVVIYMPFHRNMYWTLAIELIVLPHSALIALNRDSFHNRPHPISGQFGFGFFIILILNQMWNLGNTKPARWIIRSFLGAGFIGSLIGVYGFAKGFGWRYLYEVVFIPAMYYLLMVFYILMFAWMQRLVKKCTKEDGAARIILTIFFCLIMIAIAFAPYAFIIGG